MLAVIPRLIFITSQSLHWWGRFPWGWLLHFFVKSQYLQQQTDLHLTTILLKRKFPYEETICTDCYQSLGSVIVSGYPILEPHPITTSTSNGFHQGHFSKHYYYTYSDCYLCGYHTQTKHLTGCTAAACVELGYWDNTGQQSGKALSDCCKYSCFLYQCPMLTYPRGFSKCGRYRQFLPKHV